MTIELDGPRSGPVAGGVPDSLVVLVHGYGADGNDLADLAPVFGQAVPRAAFAAPHAPFPCADAPVGRQWFALWDRSEGQLVAGVREAASLLGAFVRAETARLGLAAERVALMGFSQGAMLVLEAGLRGAVPGPAAILAYSGALLGPYGPGVRFAATPPVLIAHGMEDSVVPVQAGEAAAQRLRESGVPVTALFRPGLEHGLDEDGIAAGARMLADALGAAAPG